MVAAVAGVAGVAALAGLGACDDGARERPRREGPRVRIEASMPGAGADEAMTSLAVPIERAVASVRGVAQVRTWVAGDDVSVELAIARGADVEAVMVAAREAVAAIHPTLPEHASPPAIRRDLPVRAPALLAIEAPPDAAAGVVDLLESTGLRLSPRCGGGAPEAIARLDPDRLAALDLTVVEVAAALQATNVDQPAGRIVAGAQEPVIRVYGRGRAQASALGELVVREGVRLGDVAQVELAPAGRCRGALDGRPHVIAEVYGPPARSDARALRAMAAEVRPRLPAGVTVELLDGPAIHGVYEAEPEQARKAIAAAHAALVEPRWFATRIDPDARRLTISIGVGRRQSANEIAVAVDRAGAAMATLAPGRWSGPGVREAAAVVTGPEPVARATKIVAALRADPAVGAAGCDPCERRPAVNVRADRDRMAALGVRVEDVVRTMELAGDDGVAVLSEPPLRLVLPEEHPGVPRLDGLRLRTPQGLVPLDAVVTIEHRAEPYALLRVDGQPAVDVWVRGDASQAALERALADAMR